MQPIEVQSIILICLAFIYTILAHVSKKKPDWNNALSNNVKISNAMRVLDSTTKRVKDISAKINLKKKELNANKNQAGNVINKELEERLKNELGELKVRNVSIVEAKNDAQNKLNELLKSGPDNKKNYNDDNADKRIHKNIADLTPSGGQMQEKSVVLVIISVLVLLLNMNGLLRSSEVGDPLQLVVGIMLVVFGVNVLVRFNKNDLTQLGTIAVLKKNPAHDKEKKQLETNIKNAMDILKALKSSISTEEENERPEDAAAVAAAAAAVDAAADAATSAADAAAADDPAAAAAVANAAGATEYFTAEEEENIALANAKTAVQKAEKALKNFKKQQRNTKSAAVFGTISGILCALLGVQILTSSFIKQRPNFKSLKNVSLKSLKNVSLKSLKRKKKK